MNPRRPPLRILFEDTHLIVAVKPAGLASQKNKDDDWSLYDEVAAHTRGGFVGLVHRLDRSVTGVMVCAKNPEAARRLSEQIKAKRFGKTYLAVVEGTFPQKKARLEHWHEKKESRAHIFGRKQPGSKSATLDYEVVEERPDRSLIRINLESGRYNQIRAQFAYIRHPVMGDNKYAKRAGTTDAIALVASELSFFHPFTGQPMRFALSSLPPHWKTFWP